MWQSQVWPCCVSPLLLVAAGYSGYNRFFQDIMKTGWKQMWERKETNRGKSMKQPCSEKKINNCSIFTNFGPEEKSPVTSPTRSPQSWHGGKKRLWGLGTAWSPAKAPSSPAQAFGDWVISHCHCRVHSPWQHQGHTIVWHLHAPVHVSTSTCEHCSLEHYNQVSVTPQ